VNFVASSADDHLCHPALLFTIVPPPEVPGRRAITSGADRWDGNTRTGARLQTGGDKERRGRLVNPKGLGTWARRIRHRG